MKMKMISLFNQPWASGQIQQSMLMLRKCFHTNYGRLQNEYGSLNDLIFALAIKQIALKADAPEQ